MLIKRLLDPKNDVAFKRIFGQEKNKDILLALLNSVLKKQIHQPIREVEFLPRVQDPETRAKKTSVVDLMCKDEDGCMYIVEMQVASDGNFKNRATYYASKAYISQANKGEDYEGLQKVIFLAFTDYKLFPQKGSHKSDHQIMDVVTYEQDLEKLCFTFVDLVTFAEQNKKPVEALTLEEKFYYFLRNAETIDPEELEKLIANDPIITKAFHELNKAYWTNDELIQ